MSDTPNPNVIHLRAPKVDPISPKTLADMTDLEQEMFLRVKRERRLRAAEAVKAANAAKAKANSLAGALKIEKKVDQLQRQLTKVDSAMDKMEELMHQLRALRLQYADDDTP
jgi:primosomal protein N''